MPGPIASVFVDLVAQSGSLDDSVRTALEGATASASDTAEEGGAKLGESIAEGLTKSSDTIDAAGKEAGTTASEAMSTALTRGTASAGSEMARSLQPGFDQIASSAGESGTKAGQSLAEGMSTGTTQGMTKVDATVRDGLSQVTTQAGETGKEAGSTLSEGMTTALSGLTSSMDEEGRKAGAAITTGVDSSMSELETSMRTAGTTAGENLTAAMSEAAKSGGTEMAAAGKEAGTEAGDGLVQGMTAGAQKAVAAAAETVKAGMATTVAETQAAGKEMGDGMATGVAPGATAAKTELSGVGTTEDSTALKTDALTSSLGRFSKIGALGFVASGGLMVKSALDFQQATANIAAQAGITTNQAQAIGNAFLKTGGQTTFTAQQMVAAYGPVAQQLAGVQGHALDAGQALDVMKASSDLAEASQTNLKDATATLASVMQSYQIPAKDAASTSDTLFAASRDTGQSIDALGASLDKTKAKLGGMAPPLSQTSALLVDMTQHGETGRSSMATLTTAFTTFLKPATDVAKAQSDLKTATDALPPSLQGLASSYEKGTMSSTDLSNATKGMSTDQATLFAKFKTAADAAKTAGDAQTNLGIATTDASGKLLPMGTIIGELQKQTAGMTTAQATAKLSADGFGSSASKLVSVVQAGPAAFDKAQDSVNKLNTAHEAAEKQANTFQGNLEKLKSAAEDTATSYGNKLLPPLKDAIGWFTQNSQVIIPVVVALGGLVLAVKAYTAISNTVKQAAAAYDQVSTAVQKLIGNHTAAGEAAAGQATSEEGVGTAAEESAAQVTGAAATETGELEGVGVAADGAAAQVEGIGTAAETAAAGVAEGTATADGELEGVGGAADGASTQIEGMGGAADTASANIATATGTADGDVAGVGAAADTSSGQIEAMGGAADTAAANIGTAMGTADGDVAGVGLAADEAGAGFDGLGLEAAAAGVEMDTAMDANPIGAIVLAIAAVGLAIYELINHWNDVENFFKKHAQDFALILAPITLGFSEVALLIYQNWGKIESFFVGLWGDVENVFKGAVSFLEDTITKWNPVALIINNWSKITSFFTGLWGDVTRGISGFISNVVSFFTGLPGKVISAIDGLYNQIASWGTRVITSAVSALTSAAGQLWSWFSGVAGKVLSAIGSGLTTLAKWGDDIITGAWNALTTGASKVWSFFSGVASKVLSSIGNGLTTLVKWGGDIITGAFNAITSTASNVFGWFERLGTTILSDVGNGLSFLAKWGGDLITGAYNAVTSAASNVFGWFERLGTTIVNDVGDGASFLLKWGGDLIHGITSGINTVISDLSGWASGIGGQVVTWAKDGATVLLQWGKDIVKGIVNGITGAAGDIGKALSDAVSGAWDTAKNTLNHIPVIGGVLSHIPGLASGGPIPAGQVTIVGEKGPEVFVPDTAGDIIPNHHVRGLADGTGASVAGAAANTAAPVAGAAAGATGPNLTGNSAATAAASVVPWTAASAQTQTIWTQMQTKYTAFNVQQLATTTSSGAKIVTAHQGFWEQVHTNSESLWNDMQSRYQASGAMQLATTMTNGARTVASEFATWSEVRGNNQATWQQMLSQYVATNTLSVANTQEYGSRTVGILSDTWQQVRAQSETTWQQMTASLETENAAQLANVTESTTAAKTATLTAYEALASGLPPIVQGIWSNTDNAYKGGINNTIGDLDKFLGGVNTVGGQVGWAVSLNVPTLAAGGRFDAATAIVGEGNAPEYVIPTDPAYGDRASALLTQMHSETGGRLGLPGFQAGGVLPPAAVDASQFLGVPYVWGGASPTGVDCCLVGSTLVTTARGDVPIKEVAVGDFVLTRKGYRRVLRSVHARKGLPAPTVTVTFSNGSTLRGTDDHRVWTENRGWVELGDLTSVDTLVLCHEAMFASSTDTVFTAIPTRRNGRTAPTSKAPATACCTERSGRTRTARSHQATRFITATATPWTTGSPTWNAFPGRTIGVTAPIHASLTPTSALSVDKSSRPWKHPSRHAGSVLVGASSGITTRSGGRRTARSTRSKRVSSCARNAALPSRGGLFESVDSARINATPVSVVERTTSGNADVYDLTVEGEPEFFANGILVHNSGLIYEVGQMLGIPVPRTSEAQYAFGPPVAPLAAGMGMPIFFDTGDAGQAPPQHVGLYMGGGSMIDAPHTGTVVQEEGVAGFGNVMGFTNPFGASAINMPVWNNLPDPPTLAGEAPAVANKLAEAVTAYLQAQQQAYLARLALQASTLGGADAGGPSGAGAGGPGSMTTAQLEALWIQAGGPPGAAANMAGIAQAESGQNPNAVQQGEPPGLTGWGLWQITPTSGIPGGSYLLDPLTNAEKAVQLFNEGGYSPWAGDPYASSHGLAMGGIIPVNHFDAGGFIPPGVSLSVNNTGAPEVVPGPGISPMALSATSSSSSRPVEVTYAPQLVVAGAGQLTAGQQAQAEAMLESYGSQFIDQLTVAQQNGVGAAGVAI